MDAQFSSSEIGDYVMMESCFDHGDAAAGERKCGGGGGRRRREKVQRRRELPPPLTVLPFSMRRFTTADGRLVLVEERRRRPECFRATRSGGRLVLEIVGFEEREDDEVEERESDEVEEREREAVRKCYDYMRVRSSPCLFGMNMPTVRPTVHI